MALAITTSIVDYLKSVGQDPSFGSRKKFFESQGLRNRLGDYVGSSAQNVALLNLAKGQFSQNKPVQAPAQQFQQPAQFGATQTVQAAQKPITPQTSPESFATIFNPATGARDFLQKGQPFPTGFALETPATRQQQAPTAPPSSAAQPAQKQGYSFEEALKLFGEKRGPSTMIPEDVPFDPATNLYTPTQAAYQRTGVQQPQTQPVAQGAVQGTSGQDRLLGPAEFSNLAALWKSQGLTQPQIEQNFLRREGKNIYLRGDAPSSESLLGARKAPSGAIPEVLGGEEPTRKIGALDTLKTLGLELPQQEDILAKTLGSPELGMLRQRAETLSGFDAATAEAQKAAQAAQFEQEKNRLEQNLAARGLTFSGIRTEQVKQLADSLAASNLGVDRKLAESLYRTNEQFKDDVLRLTEQTIKEAQDGREEAIDQLNKAGLAVIGNQLVPTQAAEREERIAQMEQLRFALQQSQFALTSAKTEQQMKIAEENLAISKARLQLAINKALTGSSSSGTGFTKTQKQKLENANLLDAGRDQQLEYLYGPAEKIRLKNVGFTNSEAVDYLMNETLTGVPMEPARWLREARAGLRRTDSMVLRIMGDTGKTKEEVRALPDAQFASAYREASVTQDLVDLMRALQPAE